MFADFNGPAAEHVRGAQLAEAAEALLAEARVDTIDAGHAVRLATANALLALYWELRRQAPVENVEVPRGRPRRRQWATEPGS